MSSRLRKPSQRSIDLYNQLVDEQNKVRKQLRKIHKSVEEASGAGRLPALVVPRSAHKIRKNYFEGLSPAQLRERLQAYWKAYREKKALFKEGMNSYLARTVMDGYRDLFIDEDHRNHGIGFKPEGAFGRYSKEQIAMHPEHEKKMLTYNALFTHGPDFFLALLYTKNIPEFKWIYIEFKDGEKEDGFLDQAVENANRFNGPKARAKLMEMAHELGVDYKHSRKALRKANRKQYNAERKRAESLDAVFAGGQDLD